MTNKHTPGPWCMDTSLHIYGSAEPQPIPGFIGGTSIEQSHICTAKSYADAALIAAAPDLLEALEAIVRFNTPLPHGLLEQARAAIAKARGEA